MADEPRTATPPTCVECGRPWVEPAERWQSRLTVDDEAALYCTAGDEREFVDG